MSASGATLKKAKKAEGSGEVDDGRDYDAETQKALEEVDSCQSELDALNEKASEEILKVEQKYNKLRKSYFERRNDIITRIPNFWVTAFVNHPHLSALLEEDDEDCLFYLTKLEVEESEDIKSGHRISFHFDDNPYFHNPILTKELRVDSSGSPVSQCTSIKWKEGHDITKKAKGKSMGKGKKRVMGQKSFFSWFTDLSDPSADDIADVLKDDLWPNPLQYYLVPDVDVENGVDREDEATDEEADGSDLEEREEDYVEDGVLIEDEEEEELGVEGE